MTKETGGPAFPLKGSTTLTTAPGMSLRDYFAAQSLKAILCDMAAKESIHNYCGSIGRTFGKEVAAQAYDLADAMLAERAK